MKGHSFISITFNFIWFTFPLCRRNWRISCLVFSLSIFEEFFYFLTRFTLKQISKYIHSIQQSSINFFNKFYNVPVSVPRRFSANAVPKSNFSLANRFSMSYFEFYLVSTCCTTTNGLKSENIVCWMSEFFLSLSRVLEMTDYFCCFSHNGIEIFFSTSFIASCKVWSEHGILLQSLDNDVQHIILSALSVTKIFFKLSWLRFHSANSFFRNSFKFDPVWRPSKFFTHKT